MGSWQGPWLTILVFLTGISLPHFHPDNTVEGTFSCTMQVLASLLQSIGDHCPMCFLGNESAAGQAATKCLNYGVSSCTWPTPNPKGISLPNAQFLSRITHYLIKQSAFLSFCRTFYLCTQFPQHNGAGGPVINALTNKSTGISKYNREWSF